MYWAHKLVIFRDPVIMNYDYLAGDLWLQVINQRKKREALEGQTSMQIIAKEEQR